MVIYRFDDFSLDTQTYELRRDGKAIPVEPQVFGVLKHLIESRDRVVSKDDLIDAVWEGRIVSDATLSKRISAARRAVDDTGETQTVIRTVPRRGFRFVADINGIDDKGTGSVELATPVPAPCIVPGPVSISVTRRWRMSAVAVAVVLIIAAGGLAWWQPWVERTEPASLERMAFPLPDKPSIAVLPFTNLSGDATQDYLGDGIANNIISALSRLADMFVVARTSTLIYKGKAVKVQQVAEELGVRYVLEGSVQRSGDRVRVTAQLIDALTGHHLWAERYQREVKDAFALQDDITLNVVTELAVKLTDGEKARILRGNTKNPEAYQMLRRGLRLFRRFTMEDNAEARRFFQKAVELDPNYAQGWQFIGLTHQVSAKFRWGEDAVKEGTRAEELAHKALAIDPSGPWAYALLANISVHRRRYDEAIGYGEKAVALAPNGAGILAQLGRTLIYAGRSEEALPLIERAIRLSPYPPPTHLRYEGLAYHSLGRYEEAVASFKHARARDPKGALQLVWLAMIYADMGRMEEARIAAQELLELNPSFSAKEFVGLLADYRDRAKAEHALTTLHQLGLPE